MILLTGCTTEPKIITKIVYKDPVIPNISKTEMPNRGIIKTNGDFLNYISECELRINQCNIDKESIIESLKGNKLDDKRNNRDKR